MVAATDRYDQSPLLGLVYGAAVTLAVVMAAALVVVVDARLSDAVMTSTVNADRELVRAFIAAELTPEDLAAPVGEPRQAELVDRLASLTTTEGLQAVTIYDSSGDRVVASPGVGTAPIGAAAERQLAAALAGRVQSSMIEFDGGRSCANTFPSSSAARSVRWLFSSGTPPLCWPRQPRSGATSSWWLAPRCSCSRACSSSSSEPLTSGWRVSHGSLWWRLVAIR